MTEITQPNNTPSRCDPQRDAWIFDSSKIRRALRSGSLRPRMTPILDDAKDSRIGKKIAFHCSVVEWYVEELRGSTLIVALF